MKRQLKREDFKKIYNIACGDWKPKLIEWYGEKFAIEDQINIKDSEYNLMRGACTQEQHKLFDEIFGKDQDIKDKVKTVEDAVKLLGENDSEVKELKALENIDSKNIDFQKLVVVIKALNNGWYPDWETSSSKFLPWFDMTGKEPSYSYWINFYSFSDATSRLLLKSNDLAEYCGKQFIDLYKAHLK